MKKKIALFMAGALALSTLPFNVFAASSNTVSNLFVGRDDFTFTSGAVDSAPGEKYFAPYLRLELKDEMVAGYDFKVTLDNAEWDKNYSASDVMIGYKGATPIDLRTESLIKEQESYGRQNYVVYNADGSYTTVTSADVVVEDVVNNGASYFDVIRDDEKNIVIRPLVNLPADTAIIIPAWGKFEGGEAVTATVESGRSSITSGTYSLTNYVDGELKVEGDSKKITIKEEVAGSLKVEQPSSGFVDGVYTGTNGRIYVQIRGSKAQWDLEGRADGDVTYSTLAGDVGVKGHRFGISLNELDADNKTLDYRYDYVYEGSDETNNQNIPLAGDQETLVVDYSAVAVDNTTGLRGDLEIDLEQVFQLTDRDYKGVIEVYVWGSGIDRADRQLVEIYDTRLSVEAKVEKDKDDKVEQLVSGRIEQTASEVTLKEKYDGSIRDDRYIKFELVDAEFTQGQVIEADNVEDGKTKLVVNPELDSRGYYTTLFIDKDDFNYKQAELNELTFTPKINIDAEHTGDIVMKVSGPGIAEEFELVIAQTVAPITIDTSVSHIKAGFTNIPTADITIKENFAGALSAGTYHVGVNTQEIKNSSLKIAEVKEELIEGEELEVRVLDYSDSQGSSAITDDSVTTASAIRFDVLAESKDEPGEFTISGIEIYADSTVPTSKDNFELHVAGTTNVDELQSYTYTENTGTSLKRTHLYYHDFDYMTTGNLDNEANAGDVSSVKGLNSKVGITLGETSYTVDGVYAGELISPAYVSNSGSTMVPVRALSYALGVSEESIFWHQATQTVTIEVSKDRTAQFTVGSDLCTINGIQYPIISANGQTDVVEVKDGYTYLPLRFIGERVFGVTVDWDNATQTATFN